MRMYFLPLFLLFSFNLFAQSKLSNYQISLTEENPCLLDCIINRSSSTKFKVLKENKMERGAVEIYFDSANFSNPENMMFELFKQHVIKESSVASIEIKIKLKAAIKTNNLQLRVVGLNAEEMQTFDTIISLKTEADQWKLNSLKINPKNTRVIIFFITYKGDNNPNQKFTFEKFELNIKSPKLNAQAFDSLKITDKLMDLVQLNKISFPSNEFSPSSLNKILGTNHYRFIGLGESTHGSKTVTDTKIQFIKGLILYQNCKVILFELEDDLVLIMDLFIQGKIDINNDIVSDYLSHIFSKKSYIDFLFWLRNYNEKTTEKIHLFGIDGSANYNNLMLMDYNMQLLGEKNARKYIKSLNNGSFKTVISMVQKDTALINLLDKQTFFYYQYILKDRIIKSENIIKKMKNYSNQEKDIFDRDSAMFQRLVYIDSLYANSNSKMAIYAHNGHLKKTGNIKGSVLGNLINEKYGSKYFTIGFQFGHGFINQDSCSFWGRNLIQKISLSFKLNHLEYIMSLSKDNFFYVPANLFGDDVHLINQVTRGTIRNNYIKFASVKKQFNGYIFSKYSEAFEINENSNPIDFMNTLSKRNKNILKLLE